MLVLHAKQKHKVEALIVVVTPSEKSWRCHPPTRQPTASVILQPSIIILTYTVQERGKDFRLLNATLWQEKFCKILRISFRLYLKVFVLDCIFEWG